MPEGAPNLTMFASYCVVDGRNPRTVVVIDDDNDMVAYETARAFMAISKAKMTG